MDNTIYNLKIISSGSNRIELYKVSNYLIRKSGDSNNNYELQEKNKAINDIYTIMCHKNKY